MPRFVEIEKLPAFQSLHMGIKTGTLAGFFGPPGACKSTLCGKLAAEVALKTDGNVLVFDTENSVDTYLAQMENWEEDFDVDINVIQMKTHISSNKQKTKRTYDVGWVSVEGEPSEDALNVYIVSCPDIADILIAMGRGMELALGDNADSGKFKVISQKDARARTIQDAPFYRFCESQNIKVIVIDSVTQPINDVPTTQENMPTRTTLTAAWMNQCHKIASELDIPILMTFHESKNEAGMSKELKVQGGKGVLYNVKYMTYLFNKNEKGLLPSYAVKPNKNTLAHGDTRAMYLMRHPYRKPWADIVYFEMTDDGLVDLEE